MNKALLSPRTILFTTIFTLLLSPLVIAQEGRGLQLSQTASQNANKRTALVIGNGAYTSSPLKNPPNDATDMAKALSNVGFTVEHGVDLTQRQMKAMIREFGQKLKAGGQGLFYFAGHGIQLKGRNYLIPVDAEIASEADVEDQGVDVNLVMGLMDEAGNGLNVVILDACRNNPFARSFRSSSNGLAQVDAPTGTLVAYSTAPGRVARDGAGRNGPYTAELLRQMRVPGLTIEEVMKRVRASLKQLTNGEQIPWESSSLVGNFYLNKAVGANTAVNNPGSGSVGVTPIANPAAVEQEYWETIKGSNDVEDFRDYLKEYPQGPHALIARSKLRQLEAIDKTTSAGTGKVGNIGSSGGWVQFNSPDGRFSITLPPGYGAFTSQQKTQPTAAGPIELYILQSENTQGACVLGYSDFPEASFVGRTPKKMLEDGRDGALKNINATLEKQEDLTAQGKTGLDIYGSTTSSGRSVYVRFRFILDKPRAYQIGYLTYNRADLDKPEVQSYFDSFRIK
jgi:Caspase domain